MDIQTILITIFGILWGSFLTVVVWRVDDLKSIFVSRSRCTDCEEEIGWYDLVPILSYGILRGKCRKCGKKISTLYPLMEVLTGLVFYLTYTNFGMSIESLLLVLIFSILIVTLGYDAIHMMIVDQFVWLGVALVVIYQFIAVNDWLLWRHVLALVGWGGLIGVSFPALLVLMSRGKWMGEGDISLGLLAGLFVGFPKIILAYILAFIAGSIYGLALMAIRRKKMSDPVPFGPFLVLGSIVAFYAGSRIIEWYLNIGYFNL